MTGQHGGGNKSTYNLFFIQYHYSSLTLLIVLAASCCVQTIFLPLYCYPIKRRKTKSEAQSRRGALHLIQTFS